MKKFDQMNILICLDNSAFTETILAFTKSFVSELKRTEITVLHIVDETLFFSTTGFEVQLGEILSGESKELKGLCEKYLGGNVKFVEEYGIPKLVADDMLPQIDHDLLVVGSHGRHGLAGRIMGGFAEHILSITEKPVIFIP